jgi:hypothetical protein
VAALDAQHVARMLLAEDAVIDQYKQQIQTLQHQLEWSKRQLPPCQYDLRHLPLRNQ